MYASNVFRKNHILLKLIQFSLYNFLLILRKVKNLLEKYIFPGGFLPSLKSIKNYTKKTGLTLRGCDSYGIHYSHTLSKWRENFIGSWNNISQQGFDNSFKKIWDFYFSYCEAGFRAKNIDLIQFSFRNE